MLRHKLLKSKIDADTNGPGARIIGIVNAQRVYAVKHGHVVDFRIITFIIRDDKQIVRADIAAQAARTGEPARGKGVAERDVLQPNELAILDKPIRKVHGGVRVQTFGHVIQRVFKEIDAVLDIGSALVFHPGVVQYFIALHTLDEDAKIKTLIIERIRDAKSIIRLRIAQNLPAILQRAGVALGSAGIGR